MGARVLINALWYNFAQTLVRQSGVVEPVPGEEGRIELMQFRGFSGRSFAAYAQPPNLGIISLRYPVADMVGWKGHLASIGVVSAAAASGVAIEGLGKVDILAVRDPEGAITEFYGAN